MLSSYTVTVRLESGEREIFVSPLLLQSKEPPDVKSGKIEILYFYDQLRDDKYRAMLEQETLAEKFKSERYVINYGQDFEKYYLGSFRIDFHAKLYSEWDGKAGKLNEQDVEILAEALFDPQSKLTHVILFTLTRPSDINLVRM